MNDARAQLRPAIRWLQRARSRARTALVAQRAGHLAAGALVVALLAGFIDFLVRFPSMLRTAALAGAVALLAALIWKRIVPALRFRPSMSSFALRAEKQRPELKGLLAAAVDFADERDADEQPTLGRGLSNIVIADAARRFGEHPPPRMVNPKPALLSLGKALLVGALALVLYTQASTLFVIGAQRVLTPWAGVEWPKRTGVVDITDLAVHPRGAAVPLRAALVKTARSPEDASVFVDYRPVTDSGRLGTTRTALLTYQGRTVEAPAQAVRGRSISDKGALFERLVEADAGAIEYRFRTSDDQTEWRRVRLIVPPAVWAAGARIVPPAYASALAEARAEDSPLAAVREALDLGAGRDERAVAPISLVGSSVELTIELNKALPPPSTIDRGFLARVFGDAVASIPDARLITDERRWTLAFTLPASVRIPVALRDEHGIESSEPAVFRFDAIDDREPGVSITDPQSDLHLLPTARVPIVVEARDDVGLHAVWATMRRFSPEGGSGPGGALEPVGQAQEMALTRAEGAREVRLTAEVDLGELEAKPGEEFEVLGLALDIRMRALGADAALPSRSQARRLRVISEAEFIEELRGELASVRADAIRAEQQQREVQSQTQVRGSDRVTRRGQSLVGERLARQREAIERLAERIERNNLEDPRISELLGEADAALRRAGESAADAQRTLDRAAQERRDELSRAGEQPPAPGDEAAELDEDAAREADQEQQEVRDQLSDLIGLLDAGEDNWVARRSLERLLEEQRALREDTAQVGAQTAGAELDELTPEQRADLRDLAQRQQELADQTERTAEDLRERADQLEQSDPTAAAGMREAARRLEQERTAETQRQAAQNAEQNRTNDANQQQEQAAQSIQEALDNLEQGEDARRDQLRRRLASVIESLRALVLQQRRELDALNAGDDGLDRGMIALNRNTLGVLDLANAGGRELAPVARLIARAGDAQSEAIVALRTRPEADLNAARDAEERSLVALREALETAERLDEQQEAIENRRMLAELRQRYRALLEREVALRANLDQFATKEELNRRERFEVRSLAEEQVAIADELSLIRQETGDLAEAKVFDFAQRALERDTVDAASALRDARAAEAIPPADATVATLAMLVRALEDAERQNPFDEGAGGGGGGGGGAGQGERPAILPIHELKLLREMQATLLDRTRIAENARDEAASERIARAQADLHGLGQELLERIQSQTQGGPTMPQIPDRPEGEPAPPVEERNPAEIRDEPSPEPESGTEAPSHAA